MSIRNIYPEIASFENMLQAEKDVSAGRRFGKEELLFWRNREENIYYLSECMKNLDFPPDIYRTFYVYEPKLRKVVTPDYNTKVIQRAAYNILNPKVCKTFIDDSYSCIKGRGSYHAMERLAGWVNYATKGGGDWYYFKGDVEKFFYRIDHEILMQIHKKKISDKKVNRFTEHYVCEASKPFGLPVGVLNPMDIEEEDMLWDVGISIGGGLSHMYGNMYMDPLDQFVKRVLRVKFYIRHADDFIILSNDKAYLHRIHREISDFMGDVLKLQLNSRTAIRPVRQGIEFVGFKIWPGCVRMKKPTALRMKRNLKNVQELYRKGNITFDRANATVQSYIALMDQCDCEDLKRSIFEGFVLTHNEKEAGDGREQSGGTSGSLYDFI